MAMVVTKSAVYRLEVAAKCGCTAAKEYADEACKKLKGKAAFNPCSGHTGEMGEMIEDILSQVVDKEAAAMVVPPRIHPRSLQHGAAEPQEGTPGSEGESPSEESPAQAPARTLRTAGSTGAVRGPSAVPSRSAPGSHRPSGGGGTGASPFRRASPGGNLSANAAAALAGGSKVAARGNASALVLDIGDGVEEDERVTQLLKATGYDEEDDPLDVVL